MIAIKYKYLESSQILNDKIVGYTVIKYFYIINILHRASLIRK